MISKSNLNLQQIYKISLPLFICLSEICLSQNPIVPPGIYIADPSAHVWKDGRLYIYGSRDESPDYFCSHRYHVLSTADLARWTLFPDTFSSKGNDDAVTYSNDYLYAPDVQYKDGKYYLYYCLANRDLTEGVAISEKPEGPFRDGTILKTGKFNEIDPCVFMDDDGQGYYIWGQFSAKIARLKPSMTEIDTSTILDGIVTEQEHRFHEGGYMIKRNAIYYLIYTGLNIKDMPTCISYATSSSPWGPFKYGGVIINNDGCDPGNWNNHGSLVEFKEQWYVYYHRATHNSKMMRKACVEPVYFNDDGSINEVEMTSQGAGAPINAFRKIEAEWACLLNGHARIEAFSENEEEVGQFYHKDRAAYKYIDFGNGADSVTIRLKTNRRSGKLWLIPDKPWLSSMASIDLKELKDQPTWQEITVKTRDVKGVHALWMMVQGDEGELFSIDWFKFSNGDAGLVKIP